MHYRVKQNSKIGARGVTVHILNNFMFCVFFPCTENIPDREFKTEVRTEPYFLCTVIPL